MNFKSNYAGTFRSFGNRIKHILFAPFEMALRKLRQKTSLTALFGKVSADVRAEVKDITKKPSSMEEYFVFGDRYIAKKLVYVVGILLMFLVVFLVNTGYPFIVEKWFTKTMVLNDAAVADYSGRVKLLSEVDKKTVIFKGKLTEGVVSGEGTLYDYDGNIVYRGSFTDGLYEGEGTLFHPNGQEKYTGGFVKNKYDGNGILYDACGNVRYEGQFSQGAYNGTGKLYYATGALRYQGSLKKASSFMTARFRAALL